MKSNISLHSVFYNSGCKYNFTFLFFFFFSTKIIIAQEEHSNDSIILNIHAEVSTDKSSSNESDTEHKLHVVPSGYLETFYSYNFNEPSNNINALRGFDFICNSLTISNFVMAVDAKYDNFSTRLALNVGMTPSQFYKQEPITASSYQIPSLGPSTWQWIQEAVIGWESKKIKGLSFQTGVMATPIGIEGLPNFQTWKGSMNNPQMHPKDYRENWNWSRSNAFINVPDYHSGVRALYSLNSKNHFSLYLINGQNMVTDNNKGKTLSVTYLWMPNEDFHVSALYMGGPERATGAPEGQGWRHLFDMHARVKLFNNLRFMAQVVAGVEDTKFGMNRFLMNVYYLKYEFKNKLDVAFRYELLTENLAAGSSGNFLKSVDENHFGGLYGYTGTISYPVVKDHLIVRFEYRYDYGTDNWFYKGELTPSTSGDYPFETNAKSQQTVCVGLVGWF